MGLILLNLQSNHEIYLDKNNPFVIGRGNLTGCADKRVSRSHGKITCTIDGKVSLRALHSNPCFFTKKGTPPVRQLNKNEEEVLSEGDCLGLLPNSYWYQITSKSKVKDKKLNDFHLEPSQWVISKPEIVPKVEMIEVERSNQQSPTPKHSASNNYNKSNTPGRDVCHEIAVPSCSGESSNVIIPPELKNTCKLPLSMYEIKGQKNLEKSFLKEYKNNMTTKSPDLTKVKQSPDTTSAHHELNTDLASNLTPVLSDIVNNKSPGEKKDCQDDSNDGGNVSKPKPGRPYCRYDSSCYRKNAQHKLEYSHPGDEDYIPYQNRPLCEYGANCYRRNLTHRRQFRHVSTEDPQTSQTLDPPVGAVASTAAGFVAGAATSSTPGSSSNLSSAAHRERPRDRYKRKRNKDRSSRSCHLSVTVSASPKQKRRKNNQTGGTNRSSFSSDFSYEDPLSSPDPFSDDYSSDDYLPSDDSEDDFDDFEYYGKDRLRDNYY